jgi:hypothetical protein
MDEGKARARVYPHNILEAFGNGCVLDLRVRFAMQLLTGPMYANVVAEAAKVGPGVPPLDIAVHALDVSTALFEVSEARGLVEPLPDDDGLNRQLMLQAARTARYSVWQQMAGGWVAAVVLPGVGAVGPLAGRTFNG